MRKLALSAAALLVAAAPLAATADISYTYVGAGYASVNPDGASRMDGFDANGSFAVQENFHVYGEGVRAKNSPITVRRIRAAGGYNMPINPGVDFVARLGWSFAKAKVSGLGSNSENGVFGQAGIRGMATPDLELNAFVTYDDIDSEFSFDVGGVWSFTPELAATVGYSYSSDFEIWNIGLRYNF